MECAEPQLRAHLVLCFQSTSSLRTVVLPDVGWQFRDPVQLSLLLNKDLRLRENSICPCFYAIGSRLSLKSQPKEVLGVLPSLSFVRNWEPRQNST